MFANHDNSTDIIEADSCFHRLTHLEDVDSGKRTLDLENIKMATLDAFDKWDVMLSEEEEKSFNKNHFDPAWAKFSKDGVVDYKDSWKFLAEVTKSLI
jgi:hypothetical protein